MVVSLLISPEMQGILVFCNGIVGILSNFFLIYLILSDTHAAAKGYRTILVIVSSYNMYYSCVHCIVDMGFLCDEVGLYMWSKRLTEFGFWPSYIGVNIYINAFTMSITLLAIHCLYRYVQISGRWKYLFSTWYGITMMVIFHFGFGILWVIFCQFSMAPSPEREALSAQELLENYNLTAKGMGYMGPVYMFPNPDGTMRIRWQCIWGSVGIMMILGVAYSIICAGCIKLYYFISSSVVSKQTKRLHFQLLRLLFAQAFAPLIFEYTPCILCVWGGFLGVPMKPYASFVPVFISVYSGADAMLAMACFKAYRQRIYNIFARLWGLPTFSTSRVYNTSNHASNHASTHVSNHLSEK